MKEPFGIGKVRRLHQQHGRRHGRPASGPGCRWRVPRRRAPRRHRFKVKHSELREAYDEWSSVTHNPEEYL